MSDTDKEVNLHDTTDASVWATEFCKNWTTALCQIPGKEGVETESDFQDTMLGWFANAIMAGVDSEARKTASERATLAAERDALKARVAELEVQLGKSDADLDQRMAALGMVPESQLLSEPPTPFSVHVACNNMDFFQEWVSKKHAEYLRMQLRYEAGQIKKDDLYEWVLAHSSAFGVVHDHLRAALKNKDASDD